MKQIEGIELGAEFIYLGRPCVALRYADEGEYQFTGVYGLVYEYADANGLIHRRNVTPREFDAFRAAIRHSN